MVACSLFALEARLLASFQKCVYAIASNVVHVANFHAVKILVLLF